MFILQTAFVAVSKFSFFFIFYHFQCFPIYFVIFFYSYCSDLLLIFKYLDILVYSYWYFISL